MRITDVEVIVLRCPWGHSGATRDWPVVLVHTDRGITGLGRGGSPDLIERRFRPLLIGEDPRRISMLWGRMYDTIWRYRAPGRAALGSIGAIDVALWDLYGKSCGEPVWRLLGGHRDVVPVYADGIGYVDRSAEEVAALVKAHSELGYRAVKFHITTSECDLAVEKVRLSREALGPEGKLMIDAFSMWDGTTAVRMARAFEPYALYWIEEPVWKDDELGNLRMVREATDVLLAAGESEGTLYRARRLIAEGGVQVLQSDIIGGGGFTGLRRMAAMADAYHAFVAPHGASYPDINCHLVAAVPNGLMVPAVPEIEPYQIWSRMYRPAFEVKGGQVAMTVCPGLGLELDEDFVAEHRAVP